MRKLTALLLLFIISLTTFGQKITVKGVVIDRETQEAVSYADVVAYNVNDTTKKAADIGLTDDNGAYILELKAGTYNIEIDYLGYTKSSVKLQVTGENNPQTMRTIRLKPNTEQLQGAVVVGKAVQVQTKGDTVEYNANTIKVPEGSAIEALIKKLPGAQVSSDGKITVNGKEIKRILVDGKEFFSDDPQVALKNLPANMVDKVKAYDKQSDEARLTGMDDNDEEAVLDLSVKKGMKHGWFGNIKGGLGGTPLHFDASAMLNRFDDDQNISLLGQGNDINQRGFGERGGGPQRGGGAGDGLNTTAMAGVNYVKDKTNLKYGGNVRYGYNDNDARKKSTSEYFQTDGNTFGRDTTAERRKRHDIGLDFQLEWKPTKLATFQFRPNVTYAKTKMDNTKRSHTLNSLMRKTNTSSSEASTEGDNLSAGGTLRYVQQFSAKKGRNLSISARANYDYSKQDQETSSRTHFFFYDNADEADVYDSLLALNRSTNDKSNSFSYNLSAAYTEPISTHHLMQFRYTFQQREADNRSYNYNQEDLSNYIDSLSSKTSNSYDSHEMELNLQGKYTKFRYKVGFNLSPQESESKTTVGPNAGTDLTQNVWNYAPNLMLRYQFNKRHMLLFRYRGQSSAPSVENLQEVIDQSDPLNIQYGNPDLKPSYANNLRLRYNNYFSGPASNLSLNASFSNTLNAVTNKVTYDNETGARTSRKVNVDGNWNGSLFATYNSPIGKTNFSANATTQGALSHDVGYTSSKTEDTQKSTTRNFSLGERLNITYSKNDYEIGVNGSVAYVNADNDLNNMANRETYDYSVGANATLVLPWELNFSTDIAYNFYDGYDEGLKENEVLWNAELSKSFLKNKAANIRVRYVDILQQQGNLKRTTSANAITDAQYNTLGSYFMVYFTYRFNTFGSASAQQNSQRGPGGFDFGPGGPMNRGGFGGPRGEGGPRNRGEWNGERRHRDFENDTTAGNTPRDSTYRKHRGPRSVRTDSTGKEVKDRPEMQFDENGNPIPPTDKDGKPIEPPSDEDGRPMPPPGMEDGEGPMMGPPPGGFDGGGPMGPPM